MKTPVLMAVLLFPTLATPLSRPPPLRIAFRGPITSESVSGLVATLADPKADQVVLELDSPGGEVGAGFELAKAVENSPALVKCVVDGEAASMAFYLLQSCDVRIMTTRSKLMAHDPFVMTREPLTSRRLEELASMMKAMQAAMGFHECRRLKITHEDCVGRISGTWWLTAPQASEVGAVDYVVTSVALVR